MCIYTLTGDVSTGFLKLWQKSSFVCARKQPSRPRDDPDHGRDTHRGRIIREGVKDFFLGNVPFRQRQGCLAEENCGVRGKIETLPAE